MHLNKITLGLLLKSTAKIFCKIESDGMFDFYLCPANSCLAYHRRFWRYLQEFWNYLGKRTYTSLFLVWFFIFLESSAPFLWTFYLDLARLWETEKHAYYQCHRRPIVSLPPSMLTAGSAEYSNVPCRPKLGHSYISPFVASN